MARDDDREKPSWSERDSRRNQSTHTREERPAGGDGRGAPRTGSASASYKRQLNALFDRGVVPEALKEKLPEGAIAPTGRQKLLREIRDATDLRVLRKTIDALLAEFGMPDEDLDVLLRILEHPDDKVLADALGKLEAYIESGKVVDRKVRFVSRLRNVEAASFDPRVQAQAGRLANRLR